MSGGPPVRSRPVLRQIVFGCQFYGLLCVAKTGFDANLIEFSRLWYVRPYAMLDSSRLRLRKPHLRVVLLSRRNNIRRRKSVRDQSRNGLTAETLSRGCMPRVAMVESADARHGHNSGLRGLSWLHGPLHWRVFAQAIVSSIYAVVTTAEAPAKTVDHTDLTLVEGSCA
jgi:hypothetical protein